MRIGIDASNLRNGGTVTHLIELLRAAEPARFGFTEVLVWAGSAVLGRIDERPWLTKCPHPLLEQARNPLEDRRHLMRAYWQKFRLKELATKAGCDLLFVPGGMDNSGFRPMVTMSRNMLPFDSKEAVRYGVSLSYMRLALLRWLQTSTFRRADGIIFLTEYARRLVSHIAGVEATATKVIPHGVSSRFSLAPRPQAPITEYSFESPFRLLYVSTIDVYKHQWRVVEAVARLRAKGLPVDLELVGPANAEALEMLTKAISRLRAGAFVHYRGAVSYGDLPALYERAHLKIFASSCENLPNILIESMAAGLPIACSNRSPMPEVLGSDAGAFFDPEECDDIESAVCRLIESPETRQSIAQAAYVRAQQYSWSRCASETFAFLADCVSRYRATDITYGRS